MTAEQQAIDKIQGDPKYVNTRYFREAAIAFKKNGGKYTFAPIGSKDWWDWWEEEERRCTEGYKVGGVKITGKHYGYMNFNQLRKMDDSQKGQKVGYKDWDFPSFWEIDYDWWWYKEIAWWGITPEKLARLNLWRNPTYLDGGRHLSCLKARRGGFSFKEAYDGVWNFHFIDGSKSYYFASLEQYLTTDGILNKVEHTLDFLNQNTDNFWLKNRMSNSTLMHQVASYKGKKGEKGGTGSEIIGVIIDDPEKVRGKEGVKITYEEGGSFKKLKKALSISVPSVTEGISLTGQISVFGTGGEEKGTHIEGLEDVFTNPNDPVFRMLPFKNDWEEGFGASECGVFIPHHMCNPSFMDVDGNVNQFAAIEYEDLIRKGLKAQRDTSKYDKRIAEYPSLPSHALMRITKSDFPKGEALLQKQRVSAREIQGLLTYGKLVNDGKNGLIFEAVPKHIGKPIDYYPHEDTDDLTSCIVVLERPQSAVVTLEDSEKRHVKTEAIPDDVYLIVVDPYYKDEAADKTSLGSIRVIKRKSRYFSDLTDREVAWYCGRPGATANLYKIALDLADWYNGMIQAEIAGGGKGLFDYAQTRRKLHRLRFEPFYINGVEIEKMPKNRNYLMDISTDDKRLGLQYFADWLKTVVGLDENGNEIWNLHYIYDTGLLDEIYKHNDEDNFDRISSWIVAMWELKELRQEERQKKKKKRKSLVERRGLFGGPAEGSNTDLKLIRIKDGEVYI